MRTRPTSVTAWLAGLQAVWLLSFQGALPAACPPQAANGALPPIDAATSLLVVSPHPDDETLCCAGAIQRVASAGGRVSVVWITSGDGSFLSALWTAGTPFPSQDQVRELAFRRMNEARAATAVLGVSPSGQLFLGYPDGGLRRLLGSGSARARFTGATRVPYTEALFPGHPYTRASLEQDFATILDRVQPTLILAPSPQDTHPDHSAAGLITLRVLGQRGELAKARYWIVHGGEGWPQPRGALPGIPLDVPPRGAQLALVPFALKDVEIEGKLRAVNSYKTQMRIMSPFLLAFVRTSELYSALPLPPFTAPSVAATDPTSDPAPRRSSPADDRARRVAANCAD